QRTARMHHEGHPQLGIAMPQDVDIAHQTDQRTLQHCTISMHHGESTSGNARTRLKVDKLQVLAEFHVVPGLETESLGFTVAADFHLVALRANWNGCIREVRQPKQDV